MIKLLWKLVGGIIWRSYSFAALGIGTLSANTRVSMRATLAH